MSEPENTGRYQDGTFAPGISGNPTGKPRGARHKTTLAVEALMEGEAEEITRTAIDAAKGGDMVAVKLVLDRVAPPRRSAPIKLELPEVNTAADVGAAIAAVVRAVADGELAPDEGATVVALLDAKRKALETVDMEFRLKALEEQFRRKP